MRSSCLRLSMLAALLAGTPLLAAAADASPLIALHTVQVQNLRIELIDLDPDDGITPAYSFDTDVLAYDSEGVLARTAKGPGGLLPTEPFSFTSEDGSVQVSSTGDTWTVSTAVTLQQALDAIGQSGSQPALIQPNIASIVAKARLQDIDITTVPLMSVTPRTRVVLSGDLSYSSFLDPQPLAEWLEGSNATGFTLSEQIGGSVGGVFQLFRFSTEPPVLPEGDVDAFDLTSGGDTRLSVNETSSGPATFGESMSFSLIHTNLDDTTTDATALMFLFADPKLQLAMSSTPIPEPATWLTMGLGLGALGLMGRRRQR